MQQFDLLEIRKNIEEKRLILGQKIEDFLLKKIAIITGFFGKIFAAKSCAFFGCLIIIAVSILVRSSRDIGHDSAAYLEIVEKMLNGGKYYHDFFEFNLPLSFIIAMIPHFMAKFFAINVIIAAEIFSNLVGILSIYFSARILLRSESVKDRTVFNLIILSFTAGYFLRVSTLQFNEFGTKSSYFLAFALPYISYHFLDELRLKKFDQIIIGCLAALLFCLKPHYGILAIIFELKKVIEKKSLKSAFCLRNYTTLVVLAFYLLILYKFFPDYLSAVSLMSSAYYQGVSLISVLKTSAREDLLAVLLFCISCFSIIRKNYFLSRLCLTVFAFALIILSEVIGGYDQRFAFYSLSLALLVLTMYFIIKDKQINWRKDGFFLVLILTVSQFDSRSVFATLFNLPCFWWILVLVLSMQWRKILKTQDFKIDGFVAKFFLPRNISSWLCFLALALAANFLIISSKTNEMPWLISVIIFAFLIYFYQRIYQKFYVTEKLSRLSACIVFTVISYFLTLHLSAIFNLKYCYYCNVFKSPNYYSSEMIKTIKTYSSKDESVVVISQLIPGTYPIITYAGRKNNLPSLQLPLLFEEIFDREHKRSEASNYLFSRLKQQLNDKKNKLVFIAIKDVAYDQRCYINFLEYYFRDPEFKKIFLENYVFLNRIIDRKISDKKVDFFGDNPASNLSQESKIIERDVEVYIRK